MYMYKFHEVKIVACKKLQEVTAYEVVLYMRSCHIHAYGVRFTHMYLTWGHDTTT